jgi:pimeloyl-ACP methyl ester carboxylesterase
MAAFRAMARAAARGFILKESLWAAVLVLMCTGAFATAPPRAESPQPAEASQPAKAAAAAGAPPLLINLDDFDGRKKKILLPDGEHLAYIDMGDPKGPSVVLIHGYTDNARDWVPLIPYLNKRYRLIVVDIRGHGQSDKPECCYARIDFAYDLKLLLDALHIQRADIVGHSLGSMITQVLAEQWPDRVRKVILISSTGGPRPGTLPKKPAYDFASEIRKLKEPIDPDSPFMVEWWASPTPVNEEFIRRQRRDAANIPLGVWLAVLEQGANTADIQSMLPKLKAPTLLIWGSKDPIMEEDVRQSLRDALPAAKVKVFEGLGHNPFWEEPEAVAKVINAYLDTP